MSDVADKRRGVSRQATALDGQRFGKLVVLRKHSTHKRTFERVWLCQCDCGNQVAKRTMTLKGRGLKHCGCECRRQGMVPNFTPGRMGFTHTKASRLLADVKRRAKNAGEACDLDIDDLKIPEFCPALGLRLDWEAGLRAPNLPSIDKVQPHLGYVKGNVRMISLRANRLKNNATLDELDQIARYVRQHLGD